MSADAIRDRRDDRGMSLVELVIATALFAIVMLAVVGLWAKAQEAYFVGSETVEVQQNVRAAVDFMVREIRATGRDVTVCAFDYAPVVAGDPSDCTTAKRDACRCKLNGTPPGSCSLSTPYNTCANVFAITEATPQTLHILADRNDDGVVTGSTAEDVRYALTTGSPCPAGIQCITRQVGGTTTAMVAVDINGFTLTYYPVPGFGPCAAVGGVIPDPCPAFTTAQLSGTPGDANQVNRDKIGRIAISITALQRFGGSDISRTVATDVVLRNRS